MMMLLLLHGSAIEASRRKLQDLKKKFDSDNVLIFEEKTDLQEILVNLQSQSLFDGERLVVIENPPVDFTFDSLTFDDSLTLILWFDHEVDTKKWPDFKPIFFPESREVSVFPFLDYLAAADNKAFLEVEKLKKADFDIYYFLTMVFYLLRNLVATPKTAPNFVKDKLQRQRKNFNLERIKSLYKDILEIDFKIKKGYLEKSQAEFLLVDKFIGH